MNLQKLNPFSSFKGKGFKHEQRVDGTTVPVRREDYNRALASRDPFVQLHNEIDRLFDNFGLPSFFGGEGQRGLSNFGGLWPSGDQRTSFNPSLNVAAEKDEYVVTLEAVGLDEKDINLEVDNQQLIISGNKHEESENRDRHYYRIERHYGTFQRVLSLPEDAIASDINASMRKGLLTIRIPRQEIETTNRRRISIGQN